MLAGTLALAFQPADFRWTRAIEAPAGAGPVAFDADAPLVAAAGRALAGLGLGKLLAVARFLALRRRA